MLGFCVGLCFDVQYFELFSSFAIILKRKRGLVALLFLFFRRLVAVNVMWVFHTVSGFCLLCVIVVFHIHTCFIIEDQELLVF